MGAFPVVFPRNSPSLPTGPSKIEAQSDFHRSTLWKLRIRLPNVRGSSSRRVAYLAAAHALVCSALVQAHHSTGVFDTTKTIELRGTIVDFKLRNPHASLVVDAQVVTNGESRGAVARWEIESQAVSMLRTLGIDAQTFERGDSITIRAWPHRDPAFRFAHAFTIVDAFGAEYVMTNSTRLFSPSLRAAASAPAEPARERDAESAPAASGIARLAGRWQQPLLRSAAGESSLPLNAAGTAAWHGYNRKRSPANNCEPINVPDIFFQPFFLFEVQIGERSIVLHHEIYDIVRTVPMHGAETPADRDGWFGVASGRIEGDTLVVESHGFRASGWGLGGEEAHGGADVPSSERKKVTERFSVSRDGRTLFYDYVLEDPAYLTETKLGRVELTRIPADTAMFPYVCDLESARMWSRTRGDAALRTTTPQ